MRAGLGVGSELDNYIAAITEIARIAGQLKTLCDNERTETGHE
jgi:hypothetical protein